MDQGYRQRTGMKCPLCHNLQHSKFDEDKYRSYFLCHYCSLIFVSRDQVLSGADELKRYESHNNNENDPDYYRYLKQVADSALIHLDSGSRGLDFGCGKTTLLSKIFKESGPHVDSYDVFFYPSEDIWQKKYDFIVLSEVIEHLNDPKNVMEKLYGVLNPQGRIFIKTKLYPERQLDFSKWFYKRDQTHIQFFNMMSLRFLAKKFDMSGPYELNSEDFYFIGGGQVPSYE